MKTRYRFSHRGGDTYYWYSETRVGPRDSRHELIQCNVDWFWRSARSTDQHSPEETP